ncbi:MAG TPA: PAS domain-containing sensor histidine kinase [Bacteroidales bacterium]
MIEITKAQVVVIAIIVIIIVVTAILFYQLILRKHKRRESYISSETDLLKALINNMPDFIYIKDTESRFVVANQHSADVLGVATPEMLIGTSDYDYYPKKMADKFFRDEQKIIKTRTPLINIEEDGYDINKNKIVVSTTKVPWIDGNGNVLGTIGIGRNITKLKEIEHKLIKQTKHLQEVNLLLEEKHEHINHQAEELATQAENLKHLNEELQKINETKDKFISIIAHDLKNPFNAIINFSELLLLKVDPSIDPKQLEMMDIINSSSKMAYSLLENLLYWGKSQSASIPFRPINLNISETSNEVVEFLEVSARLKSISLVNELQPDIIVFADHDMITTILRNLVSNAIKFTPKNGSIKISSNIENEFCIITVTDTGIGISAQKIANLFVAENETTKGTSGESGTGLGLMLCKEFAVKNGGDILVKSEEGQGSSFILSLPLAAHF